MDVNEKMEQSEKRRKAGTQTCSQAIIRILVDCRSQ